MSELPSLSLPLSEQPISLISSSPASLLSSSSSSSSLVVLESQLISNAQRILQSRHGQMQTYHGDGWVLFQFAPITDKNELNKEVEKLCETLVKDVGAKTSVVLTGDKEESSFANITERALPFVQFVNSMSESGQIPTALTTFEEEEKESMPAANDVSITDNEIENKKESSFGEKTTTSNTNDTLSKMMELIYSDLVQEVTKGVTTVVDFPRAMCSGSGSRVDVIVHSRLCVSAYSATTLNLGADDRFSEYDDATYGKVNSTQEVNTNERNEQYTPAKLKVMKLGNSGNSSSDDNDDDDDDEDDDEVAKNNADKVNIASKITDVPNVKSSTEFMKRAAHHRAKELLDTSFLATSFSFTKLPSGPLGKI